MSTHGKYIEQYKKLHASKKYGVSSEQLVERINASIAGHEFESVLDFGCGQSKMVDKLNVPKKYRYDPAIPAYDALPVDEVDLVVCTDVLEHVPEEELDDVLKELSSLSEDAYFVIGTALAYHTLPNGENCHCTVHNDDWWIKKLSGFYKHIKKLPSQRNGVVTLKTF